MVVKRSFAGLDRLLDGPGKFRAWVMGVRIIGAGYWRSAHLLDRPGVETARMIPQLMYDSEDDAVLVAVWQALGQVPSGSSLDVFCSIQGVVDILNGLSPPSPENVLEADDYHIEWDFFRRGKERGIIVKAIYEPKKGSRSQGIYSELAKFTRRRERERHTGFSTIN